MLSLALTAIVGFTSITVRVDGRGFLRFDHKGQVAYAAQATLTARGGVLATPEGDTLLPEIAIPANVNSISIDLDGTVRAARGDLGRLVLVNLPGEKVRPGMFTSTVTGKIGCPGEGLFGVIRSGGPKLVAVSKIDKIEKAPVAEKATVLVRLRTELENPTYTLGEIADIQAPDSLLGRIKEISLGASPAPGIERIVTAPYISAKMRGLGLTYDQFSVEVPDGAKVAAKSQTIESDALMQEAWKAIESAAETDLKLVAGRAPANVAIPCGEYRVSAAVVSKGSATYDVNLVITQEGRSLATRTVSFSPEPGTAQIRAGETILVRVIQNGAKVEFSARAMSSGFVGQTIPVQTTTAPLANFNGKIKAAGLVEVRL